MSIHHNQVGYDPRLPEKAIITGKGEHCMVISERVFTESRCKSEGDKKNFDLVLSPAVFVAAYFNTL